MYVNSAAMALVSRPAQFDVIVPENMFGDILSDEAGAVVGSLGLLPSASVGGKVGLYEPIHGSAPEDRKSTRLNSSHLGISYAVFCLKKKKKTRKFSLLQFSIENQRPCSQ